jgi:3-oxoacyl-[acyl-carrier-protein] synthase-3
MPETNARMDALTPRIAGIAYALPARSVTVRELDGRGQLESRPELLEEFGFAQVCVATTETPYEMALQAAGQLLDRNGIDPESIGLLIYGGPQGPTAFTTAPAPDVSAASHRTLARFAFPGTKLQHDLGLTGASTFGLDQLACTTLFTSIRVARALCLAEGIDRALCVVSEFFPADAGREALFNCSSDAGVAVLVERTGGPNRIVASAHVTKGYYWDPQARRDEIAAAYFPTAKHVIERTLADAGWSRSDVDWVIPHNVSERSWQILLGLTGLTAARIWSRNIARVGHTLAGDNFINLADALDSGAVEPGQRLLLFSFGYGAHWTGLAVEA